MGRGGGEDSPAIAAAPEALRQRQPGGCRQVAPTGFKLPSGCSGETGGSVVCRVDRNVRRVVVCRSRPVRYVARAGGVPGRTKRPGGGLGLGRRDRRRVPSASGSRIG